MITEPKLPLREMRIDLREVPNHLNSVRIETNDMRFNIAPRQEEKLLRQGDKGEELISKIQDELHNFANYLQSRTADRAIARLALDSDAKQQLQKTTQTADEGLAEALRNGHLAYFVEHTPEPNNANIMHPFRSENINISDCKRVMHDAVTACKADGFYILKHKVQFVIFEIVHGIFRETSKKLTKRLAHLHIQVKPHTIKKTSVRGYKVKWHTSNGELAHWVEQFEEKKPERMSRNVVSAVRLGKK